MPLGLACGWGKLRASSIAGQGACSYQSAGIALVSLSGAGDIRARRRTEFEKLTRVIGQHAQQLKR
jgi:hypothetical protein